MANPGVEMEKLHKFQGMLKELILGANQVMGKGTFFFFIAGLELSTKNTLDDLGACCPMCGLAVTTARTAAEEAARINIEKLEEGLDALSSGQEI